MVKQSWKSTNTSKNFKLSEEAMWSVCDYVFSFSFRLSIKHRYRRIHQTDSLSLRQFLMDLKFHSVFLLTEKYGNSYIAKPVHKACLSINLIKTCEKAALSGSAAPEFKLTQVTFFILDFSRCILLKEELESEVYSKVIFFDIQVIVIDSTTVVCQPTSRFVLCVGWSEKCA